MQLSLGKADRIRTNDIVGAVAGETGVASHGLGVILVAERASFVEIPKEHAEFVIKVMIYTTH